MLICLPPPSSVSDFNMSSMLKMANVVLTCSLVSNFFWLLNLEDTYKCEDLAKGSLCILGPPLNHARGKGFLGWASCTPVDVVQHSPQWS